MRIVFSTIFAVITAELSVILSQPHIALKQETLSDCFLKKSALADVFGMYLVCDYSYKIPYY